MSRRREQQAAQAAAQAAALASEAGRVLQQRAQERSEPEESKPQRPEGWRPPARNEPRQAAIAELEQKEKERASELEKMHRGEPEKQEAQPEPKPEQKAEQQEAAPVAEPTVEPQPQPEATTPKTVKVKIYGEEKDVPEAEVEEYGGVKGYQIAMAAKKDREELKAQLDQARQQSQLIAQLIQQQQKPPEPVQAPEQIVASLMDEIRFGTQEQAAAAFQKALQAINKTPDESQIILKATVNFQHDAAQKVFQREFADVLATPELKQFATLLAQQQLSQYMQNGQPNWQALATVDFDSQYRTIGNRIRSMVGGKTQATPSAVTGNTSASDKEAKKASIVNLPTASQRAALPAEEKPATREEILNQARKARGLPAA